MKSRRSEMESKDYLLIWGEDTSEGRAGTEALELTNWIKGGNGRDGGCEREKGEGDSLDHCDKREGERGKEGQRGVELFGFRCEELLD